MDEAALANALLKLGPAARADLRRLLVRDQPNRDAVAERLLRRHTRGAKTMSDLIDMLTLDDTARLKVVRLLGELEAADP